MSRALSLRAFARDHALRHMALAKSLFALGASRVVPIAVGLISFPLLAKLLPIEEYGRLNLVISMVNLASLAAGSWLSSAIQRFYSGYGDSDRRALDAWICFRAIPAGGLAGAIAVLLLSFAYPAAFDLFLVAAGTMFFQLAYAAAVAIMQAKLEFRAALWAEAGKGAGYVLLLAVLVAGFGFGAMGAVAALAGSTLIVSLVMLWRLRPSLRAPHAAFAATFLAYGLPMTASSLCSWITQLSDRWFLVASHGEASVGAYAANYSLVDYLVRYPMAIVLTLISLKLFRRSGADGQGAALARMRAARPLVLGAGLIFALVPMVAGQWLVGVLATGEYRLDWSVQAALAVGQWLQVVAMFEGIALQIRHRTSAIFAVTLVSAGVNLIANYALIAPMGPLGAALATLVSYGILAGAMIAMCILSARRGAASA